MVDLNNLLGNRWLRFWVNPYADQVRGTMLSERIAESETQQLATEKALEEETRLLYVGITRARDYLVIPSRRGKTTDWLNRVWNGNSEHVALDPDISESPWAWNGKVVPVHTVVQLMPPDFPVTPFAEEEVYFIEKPSGKRMHLPVAKKKTLDVGR
jgi:hypothetical protein